ncbi:hypothetical protein BD311DRAFT_798262 [Dichomitus squalens]|uniref:FAD/NAD(P)-binding domain-containing protein n=1 Tax=Dichomitus squalens TaxID=114155 RepID=A0A4Q9MIM7_9APHY|nr:hypothetical protein BD311DRAFT_798262 [Dichomitus squalens]
MDLCMFLLSKGQRLPSRMAAGFSGILAGIRFPQKIPNVDLVIYEKSAGVGGTWYNNRYPITLNYQFSFEDKRDWSAFYPPGSEIQEHLQDVVDRYKLMRYIKLKHEVVHAQYDAPTGKWHVRIRPTGAGGESGGALDEFEDVADVLITAFGVITRWKMPDIAGIDLPFKIIGRNGVHLNEKWKPYPKTYLSVAADGFPNMFMSLGPNSATAKIQRERLKSMEAKPKAVKDFDRYIESCFPKTVFSANCRSWYKLGKAEGRVVGLWPGSNVHAMRALQHPRWEDYEYEYADSEDNSLYWLGDGQTWAEKNQQGDRAWYLREELIDRPPVPQDV